MLLHYNSKFKATQLFGKKQLFIGLKDGFELELELKGLKEKTLKRF